MSIKLFCNWFVQCAILWFDASLKQAVQPELSLIHVLQSSQPFLLIFNRNWVRIVTNQDQSVIFVFLLNEWWFILLLNTLSIILYTYSNTFSGFESTTVRAIRKYNFKEDDCLNLISAYTISLQVFGKWRSIGNRFRDNSKLLSTPSEEKDQARLKNYHHRSLQHKR